MNMEAPTKRQRMSRAIWIGLGMCVAMVVALAWLLGWGADPAPPVPQVAGVFMSDLYPEWVRRGGGAAPLPPMLNGFGEPNFTQAEQVPWMLWRARQQGSPLHQMMRKMGPRMPAAIQSRLPIPVDPEDTRTRIGMDFETGLVNRGLEYSDILREVLRLPHGGQQRLTGVLRHLGRSPMPFRPQAGDGTPELLLRLAREADPAIRVVAGVQLVEWYVGPPRAMGDALQPLLLQSAKDRAGELVDWIRLIRPSVALPASSFAYDPILAELGSHRDPTVALLARSALSLRTRPSELAALIRAEFGGSDFVRQKLLLNLLSLASPKQISQLPSDVATELVRVLATENLTAPPGRAGATRTLQDLDYQLWQKSSPAAAAHLLLAMGTNAVTVAPSMVEALDAARSVHRDAAMSLAAALAGLSHHVAIPVDERILHAVQDPFLTEPILGVIGAGGRANAHAFALVAPFLRSDVSGIRRAAFDAALRIHAPDADLWPHVREALQDVVRQDLALRAVPQFGAQAREVLPRLREIASDPSEARGMAELRRLAAEAIRAVEVSVATP
jgi:hypothetical protein